MDKVRGKGDLCESNGERSSTTHKCWHVYFANLIYDASTTNMCLVPFLQLSVHVCKVPDGWHLPERRAASPVPRGALSAPDSEPSFNGNKVINLPFAHHQSQFPQ